MAKQKVFNVDQLPSGIGKGRIEWDLRDQECNIQMRHKKEGWIIQGQWVEWDEEKQDWVDRPMTEIEATDMLLKLKLIAPDGTDAAKLLQ